MGKIHGKERVLNSRLILPSRGRVAETAGLGLIKGDIMVKPAPSKRIIGQCSSADFASIEHLVDALEKPEDLDTSTLKHTQVLAFKFIDDARQRGISWKLIRSVVKEVLFWGEGDHIKEIEVKFWSKREGLLEFRKLWLKQKEAPNAEDKGIRSL